MNPEVTTLYGKYRGSKQRSSEGFDYYAFKGIPYAEPPVGELRFKDPVPLKSCSSTKVIDALEFKPMCSQFDPIGQITGGSEDCLYLNVYFTCVPEKSPKRKPVMFYIHGGGFFFGSGDDAFYGPEYLLKKDIILVTINYRLGIFGFLNLQHQVAPGNQGLKDQVMALEWVRDNIDYFGGDPDNVTIFGQSAGGASVHYLTLSPMAKGLFHKAISHSGVVTCPWASVYGDPRNAAYKICERLGKKTINPLEIVDFLRTVDASKLVEVQAEMGIPMTKESLFSLFGPGVDDCSTMPFMPIPIEVAAKEGAHVPYIIGQTDREGSLMFTNFESAKDPQVKNDIFKSSLHPAVLDMLQNHGLFPEDLKQLYFKGGKITAENMEIATDLQGDMFFNYFIHQVVKAQVERSSAPTYFYEFAYDQGYSITKLMHNLKTRGVMHLDDLIYVFSMKFLKDLNIDPVQDRNHHKVMEQMIEMWTNFAKTGNPTVTKSETVPVHWLPVTDGTVLRHLHIGENLQMRKMLNLDEKFSYKRSQ